MVAVRAEPRALPIARASLGPSRLLAGGFSGGAAESLQDHLNRLGPPMGELLDHPNRVVDQVARSGLRGRGGAGFPAGRKLELARRSRAPGLVVVGNGSETEPASAKDELLCLRRPHLILDGLEAAAFALNADRVFVVAPTSAAEAALTSAVGERGAAGAPEAEVYLGPGRFVGGEETALVSWLEGGSALPRYKPPRLVERGWRGRPTLVHNVETLAHLGLVVRFGAGWFRSLGTGDEPGTMLVTVGGAVLRPGVYEVPLGESIASVLGASGAEPDLDAVLVGGYFGAWMRPQQFGSAILSRAGLAAFGSGPGAGVIHALGPSSCGLVETHRLVSWLANQSAGQCGPCVFGLRSMAEAVGELAGTGNASPRSEQLLERWGGQVLGRGACRHPDGVVALVRSALSAFRDELHGHRAGCCRGYGESSLPLPEP